METIILAIQARILLWVGVGWLVIGLGLGYDPAMVAFRALLAAVATMIVSGWLMRSFTRSITEAAVAARVEQMEQARKDQAKPAGEAKP